MTAADFLELALGNLWRNKLRALLTIAGIVIAIATFVAMLSFAAGNQAYFAGAFRELGLLTRMNVYPPEVSAAGAESDTTAAPLLDAAAVRRLARIPGVKQAFPYVSFQVTAAVADTQIATEARALPLEALDTGFFRAVLDSAGFSAAGAREAIVTPEFAELVGVEPADSLIGQRLVISIRVANLDTALVRAFGEGGEWLARRARGVRPDSLGDEGYRRRLLRRELGAGLGRLLRELLGRQVEVADTLVIRAVGADFSQYYTGMAPIVIPEETARRLSGGGINLGGDPATLLSILRSGSLTTEAGASPGAYPRVSLELDPLASHAAVRDSVEALGFSAFSFAEQVDEIQRFMVYYYAGLGVIGLIALATASLGIVNTMVMSITERRREIGILKSLGADAREIRILYLVESGAMGAVGSLLGIGCGWLATRVVSMVMRAIMAREEMLVFDPFILPLWLIALALVFGTAVSVLAGTYPAARAAALDPVAALRSE